MGEKLTKREQIAAKALQGFCANPAVFASNDICGWSLVNCTDEQLVSLCYRLADAMISAKDKLA